MDVRRCFGDGCLLFSSSSIGSTLLTWYVFLLKGLKSLGFLNAEDVGVPSPACGNKNPIFIDYSLKRREYMNSTSLSANTQWTIRIMHSTLNVTKIRVPENDRVYFRRRPLANLSPCGYFDLLPKEIIHELFSFLPLSVIGDLSLTSEAMRLMVVGWWKISTNIILS